MLLPETEQYKNYFFKYVQISVVVVDPVDLYLIGLLDPDLTFLSKILDPDLTFFYQRFNKI